MGYIPFAAFWSQVRVGHAGDFFLQLEVKVGAALVSQLCFDIKPAAYRELAAWY